MFYNRGIEFWLRPRSPANYASTMMYHPHGALDRMSLQSGKVEQTCYNSRLQPVGLRLGSGTPANCTPPELNGGRDLLNLAFSYGTSNNNGNVQDQTIASLKQPGGTPDEYLKQRQVYTYDGVNRISTVNESVIAGGSAGGGWGQGFSYDQFGNMWVSSTTNYALAPGAPSQQSHINAATNRLRLAGISYDNAGNVLGFPLGAALYDGENGQKQFASGSTTVFVYDAFGNLAADYSTAQATGTAGRFFRTTDHLGSTRLVTNIAGAVVSRHDFAPFGEELQASSAAGNRTLTFGYGVPSFRQKFTGKERDLESGLDYFGARYMSSAQGRFASPDLVNLTAKRLVNPANTLNKYVYAGNNPLLYVDPTGLDITFFYRAPSGKPHDPGHVLLAVTNQATGAFRFADYYPNVANKGFWRTPGVMNQDMTSDRLQKHAALTIQTTPEVARKLIDAIDTLSADVPTFWIPTSNCTIVCADLLSLAGIDVPSPLTSPTTLWSVLYGSYSAEALSGGQLKMGLYRYQLGKDFGASMSVFSKGTDPFYNLQLLYRLADQQKQTSSQVPQTTVCTDDHLGNKSCSTQ